MDHFYVGQKISLSAQRILFALPHVRQTKLFRSTANLVNRFYYVLFLRKPAKIKLP
jgi:hypothetical protein